MKALIHIGLPKAGSSSLQEFLRLNGPALRNRGLRHAPLDPRFGSQFELAAMGRHLTGMGIEDTAARLVLGLTGPQDLAAYAERYRRFLAEGLATWPEPLFVASCEHIHPWLTRPAPIAALHGFLQHRFEGARYVLYLRPQADVLLSAYSERIRRGERPNLQTHLDARLPRLNYSAQVVLWEGVVGADRLDVRLLTPDALTGGDLIADFCALMGTTTDGLQMPRRMNPALSREEIALRRWLNRWLPVRRADGARNPWYQRALRLALALAPKTRTPLTLTDAQRAAIDARVAPWNEALRLHRFPDRAALF